MLAAVVVIVRSTVGEGLGGVGFDGTDGVGVGVGVGVAADGEVGAGVGSTLGVLAVGPATSEQPVRAPSNSTAPTKRLTMPGP
jgi:hypothetical protein